MKKLIQSSIFKRFLILLILLFVYTIICAFSYVNAVSSNIESNVFLRCKSLESVKISKKIKKLSASTFESCSSLKNVDIPDSVSVIESGAFMECANLHDIRLSTTINKTP